jgi:hypothetical protein
MLEGFQAYLWSNLRPLEGGLNFTARWQNIWKDLSAGFRRPYSANFSLEEPQICRRVLEKRYDRHARVQQ